MYKFLGIGAQKAGTTWLYEMLRQHPDISFPLNKEVHYWNNQYPTRKPSDYFSNFKNSTLFEGEITPAYAFLSPNTIKEIHHYQPKLRIIFVIRNPIERAWSSAKMALGRAEMEFHEASDQWFIDHFNSNGSLSRGDYEACLRNWRNVFDDDDQILVLNFDEVKHSPEEVLIKCCRHLGIDNFDTPLLKSMKIHHQVFSTTKRNLNSKLHLHLSNLYKEKIIKLESYLNQDFSNWL